MRIARSSSRQDDARRRRCNTKPVRERHGTIAQEHCHGRVVVHRVTDDVGQLAAGSGNHRTRKASWLQLHVEPQRTIEHAWVEVYESPGECLDALQRGDAG